MARAVPFALNHMTLARAGALECLDTARALGCVGVEMRNDLSRPLFDDLEPEEFAAACRARGLRLLAVAEVKAFNAVSAATIAEAERLAGIARRAGAEAVSLIPRNDGEMIAPAERLRALREAIRELGPRLEAAGLVGLIEPLGFETSSLRFKAEAAEAIAAEGAEGRFALIHDTFHHHIAGERAFFAELTGIVHISGVTADIPPGAMRDVHRALVDGADRLGNIAQLRALIDAGYDGPISYEAFAEGVHALAAPAEALRQSMQHVLGTLESEAA